MALKGRQALLQKMERMGKAPRAAAREALRKSADEINALQRRLAPVVSGDLQLSIRYTFGSYKPENANVRGVGASGGTGDPDLTVHFHAGDAKAFYAAWIEFGTAGPWEIKGKFIGSTHPGFAAQPFFYPAFRSLRRKAMSRITRALRKAIKDAAS